jgi:hypothetical protein
LAEYTSMAKSAAYQHEEPDWQALIGIYEEALDELHALTDPQPLADVLTEGYGEVILEQHVRGEIP